MSVTLLPNLLPLDMNSGNSVKAETGDYKLVTYRFDRNALRPGALKSVHSVYEFDRTRTVPIVSSGGDWVITEFFPANSHYPTCRYQMLSKVVQTQYVLSKRGMVERIADVGWTTDSSDTLRTTDEVMSIKKHATWIRVFDVGPKGTLRFVAAAVSKSDGIRGSDDRPPKQDELRFGRVDGGEQWANQRLFESTFNLDLGANKIVKYNQ